MLNSGTQQANPWDEFTADFNSEFEQTNRSIRELNQLIEQCQTELNRITQKNTTITTQLQQLHSSLENIPRQDIRNLYDLALDTQQRLLIMRGQLEKLQTEQTSLKKYQGMLEKVRNGMDSNKSISSGKKDSAAETVQMLINAQEVERQRLSRQMHDGPAQALSNFILQTEIAMRLFDVDQTRAKDELTSLKNSALTTFQKVRNFIFELRPMMLDDLGLVPTIKRYVDTFKEQTGMDVELVITGSETRMASYLEVMIFRSIQDLLGNASRHSQASKTKVLLNIETDLVRVSVDDNGKGYQPEELLNDPNLGIKLMRDRVEMLGGHSEIDSVVGQGTRITIEMPMAKAVEPAAK
jgi:two-component system, NarL family, sensor histidine kinase DegS